MLISVCVRVCAQSCLTLWDPVYCCPPGSSQSLCGISQARRLEWVAISFTRASYWDRTCVSCIGKRFFTTSATWVLVLISTVQRKWFCYTYIFFSLGIPWVGKIPWRRKWQPTPVFMPGKSHGPRNLVGYSPWGHKESDMTERLLYYSFPHGLSQDTE